MKKLFIILSVVLAALLIVVSCSEKPATNNITSGDTTEKGYFPKAFNKRTFRIKGTDSSRAVTTSGNNEYYFITTSDNTLNFDLHQNEVLDDEGSVVSEAVTTSYNVSVTVTVDGTSCTATAKDGSTYKFTSATDEDGTTYTVAINNTTKNTCYNGTYTIETVTQPVDDWPLGIELYQDISSEAGTCPSRVMITPAGIYFVFLSAPSHEAIDESSWTSFTKNYSFYSTSVIKKTSDGFTAGDGTYQKLTFAKAKNRGYSLTLDDGATMTWNLVKAEYDYSFFFNEGMLERFAVTTPVS